VRARVGVTVLAFCLAPVSLSFAAANQEPPLTVDAAEFTSIGVGGMSVHLAWTLRQRVPRLEVLMLGPSTRRALIFDESDGALVEPGSSESGLSVHRFPGFFRPGEYTFRFSIVANGAPFSVEEFATLTPGREGLLRSAWISQAKNGRPLRNQCPAAVKVGTSNCLHSFVYSIRSGGSRLWAHFRFWAGPAGRAVQLSWSGPRGFHWTGRRAVRGDRVATAMIVPGGRLLPGRYRCAIRANGVLLKALVVTLR
jgi:hypothetical protein